MLLSKVFHTDKDLEIRSIMFDSRKESPDSIFFAMKGKINETIVSFSAPNEQLLFLKAQ